VRPDVAPQAAQATTLDLRRARLWQERAVGLLRGPRLLPGQGLWMERCRAVHTIGMRYPIAVFFLDANDRVTSAIGFLRPYSGAIDRTAVSVIETRHVSAGDLCRAVACVEHSALLVRSRDDV